MTKLFGVAIIVFVGWGSVRLMTVLSADAMAMAVGVLFGILAGVPTTLLALAGNRRNDGHQAGTQPRYTVIAGNGSPYVLDTRTGERFAIACTERSRSVAPRYEVVKHED